MFERLLLSGTAGGKGKGRKRGLFNRPILASDGGVDWYGEVLAENFMTGTQLLDAIHVPHFGSAADNEAGWLHVGLDGKQMLIAKKLLRTRHTKSPLVSYNLIDGSRVLEYGGKKFKVRLLKGTNSTVGTAQVGADLPITHGSEWNRIFYRLTEGVANKESEAPFQHLAFFSESDINSGKVSFVVENAGSYVVARGGEYGVTGYVGRVGNVSDGARGWRPALELINE